MALVQQFFLMPVEDQRGQTGDAGAALQDLSIDLGEAFDIDSQRRARCGA